MQLGHKGLAQSFIHGSRSLCSGLSVCDVRGSIALILSTIYLSLTYPSSEDLV